MTDEGGNSDLQAMCLTLGELDIAVLDRIENVHTEDPNLARLGALQSLAMAAASHRDVPEALAQVGRDLSMEVARYNHENVREQLDELRGHC